MIDGATRLVGLLGQPVAGSLSPRMHNAAFAEQELDWAYVPLEVPPERLSEAVAGLRALGFLGANVTIPHKVAAVELCDELEPFAERAESVNTLVVRDGRLLGASTDAEALRALPATPRRAAVLGAGGAARAFVRALEDGGTEVLVFSRRGEWPPNVDDVDLIVNATPVRDEPLVQLRREQAVVDLAYRADGRATALVEAAVAAGCETVFDGLEVLLRQGAASFERWTGLDAPIETMRGALRG